ncbi:hypothetical protein ACFRFL_45615 [Streptomyces sp. NPDC056708]|uniref:hypothetical protein n=1 Tax=unclassified Streptomyces TaxID=2593676 RepID=UPI0036C296C3
MSAPTPAGTEPEEGRGHQPPAFGRPSPALLTRADRGYARFLANTTQAAPDDHTGHHDHHNGAARHR